MQTRGLFGRVLLGRVLLGRVLLGRVFFSSSRGLLRHPPSAATSRRTRAASSRAHDREATPGAPQ